MLAAEFESGKASRPQSTSKLLFFPGLLAPKTAGGGRGIHRRHITNGYPRRQGERPPLPNPLLQRRRGSWPRTDAAYSPMIINATGAGVRGKSVPACRSAGGLVVVSERPPTSQPIPPFLVGNRSIPFDNGPAELWLRTKSTFTM